MTGRSPFIKQNDIYDDSKITVNLRVRDYKQDLDFPPFMSEKAVDFLRKCLKRDPKKRWSIAQLLKHPFVADQAKNYWQMVDDGRASHLPSPTLDKSPKTFGKTTSDKIVGTMLSPILDLTKGDHSTQNSWTVGGSGGVFRFSRGREDDNASPKVDIGNVLSVVPRPGSRMSDASREPASARRLQAH